jgi:hypothetical protein
MDRWHVSQIGRFSSLNCRPALAEWMIARLLAVTMMSSRRWEPTRYPEECSELKTSWYADRIPEKLADWSPRGRMPEIPTE